MGARPGVAAIPDTISASRYLSRSPPNGLEHVKATVVGLVSPHVLQVVDLARKADSGINVDWHLRDTVARTVDDLGHQYNARDLLSAYIHGLETAAGEAGPNRKGYADALQVAAAMARRQLETGD